MGALGVPPGFAIVRVPKDGNCLFSSFVTQFLPCSVWCSEYADRAHRLREEVVGHLRRSLPRYRISLIESARGKWPELLDCDLLVSSYLDDLLLDGVWGGEEVLQAVSEMCGVKVEVYQYGVVPIVFGLSCNRVARLLYTNNSHYDGLCSVPLDICSPVHSPLARRVRQVQADSSSFRLRPGVFISPASSLGESRSSFCIATWNVRGCALASKQLLLDRALCKVGVDIVGLQETNSVALQIDTANYSWYLSHARRSVPVARNRGVRNGVGVLIRRSCGFQVRFFGGLSERLCFALIKVRGLRDLLGVCVHFRSDSRLTVSHFLVQQISALIRKYGKSRDVFVLGDFNAHIGADQLHLPHSGLVGKNLYHSKTTERGDLLIELAVQNSLTLCTTFGRRSCLTTWSGPGSSSSQLDHILFRRERSLLEVCSVQGTFADKFPVRLKGSVVQRFLSDHKLVFGLVSLRVGRSSVSEVVNMSDQLHADYERRDFRRWDLALLRDPEVLGQFRSSVVSNLVERGLVFDGVLCFPSTLSVGEVWRGLVHSIRVSSNLVLSKPVRLTPGQKGALDALKVALARRPFNPHLVSNCRSRVRDELRKSKADECREFFRNLNEVNPFNRLRQTYQFIRSYRQSCGVSGVYIPLSRWEQTLSGTAGDPVPLVPERDHWPLGLPPSRDEIETILSSIRRGTAPGLDQLSIELFQSLPEEGISVFLHVMQQVWLLNAPPTEWLETVQFPLSKKRKPATVLDYRRITLSDVGYRVYAKFLLTRLESVYTEVGSYQAAFMRNRSADDHMFVLRRVVDEEWKTGETVYVLSLDLRQAFDTIDLRQTAIILSHNGIPHHLVNRIVQACLHEVTSLIWCRQRTRSFQRGVGLKQGCPLSPTLFNLVLDAVLQTLAEVVPGLRLSQDLGIELPLILAYADDLLLISNDLGSLSILLVELVPLLSSLGLKVNEEKSEILLRPFDSTLTTLTVGGLSFRVCSTLRYLGTYVTANLSRSETIRKRCRQAQGVVRMLSKFIREHRISLPLVLQMYKQLVTPIMTYGLRVAVLTKACRLRLARYEKSSLVQLLQYCGDRPRRVCVRRILKGKTINRRVAASRVSFWGHVLRRSRGHLLHAASLYTRGFRKLGRPIFTWHDSIRRDIERVSVPKTVLEGVAKSGKSCLKRQVDQIYDSDRSSSNESDDFNFGSDPG